VASTIWSGLVLGGIYAIIASGFTLSLVPSGVFNFAQGALVVAGTFLAYYWFVDVGLGLVPALVLNALIGAVAGIICEVTTVRPLRWGGAVRGSHAELITTVGMATAITGALGLAWGYLPLQVPFEGPTKAVAILGINVDPVEIIVVVGAVLVAAGCSLWFKRTRTGQACLAIAEDRDAAMLRGVNVNVLSIAGFAAAGLLAGVAAFVIGPITYALPTLGHTFALGGFVAIALGGEGSFNGALLGGFVVGLVSAFAARYLGANYADIAILVVLLLTLGLRPKGLGGAAEARHV
jgi:branched-chain amino acid transport system permease protein